MVNVHEKEGSKIFWYAFQAINFESKCLTLEALGVKESSFRKVYRFHPNFLICHVLFVVWME